MPSAKKGGGEGGQGLLAERREADAARGAGKERRAKRLFQLLDMRGDRAGGDAQFLRGGGEPAEAGGGLERAERCQGQVFRAGRGDGHVRLIFSEPRFSQI